MTALLALYEEILLDRAVLELAPAPRMLFVVHGSVEIGGTAFTDGRAWHGEQAVRATAGEGGATLWRWELLDGSAKAAQLRNGEDKAGLGRSIQKLVAPIAALPSGDLLLRGDSVAFPPGGSALLHTHQGPGIRCLIEGGIRIDTHGRSTSYGPGGAWFESGPEPVFAQAALDRPSRFIRVMVLPRALLGQSSIRYVNEEDRTKPKSQRYEIFVDAPIARPSGS